MAAFCARSLAVAVPSGCPRVRAAQGGTTSSPPLRPRSGLCRKRSLPALTVRPAEVYRIGRGIEAASRADGVERDAREAEARAKAAEGERDRLAAQVAALIERIPGASETKGE